MIEPKSATNIFVIIIAIIAAMTLGDYLGHKIGRWRLAIILGIIALVVIVLFAIYAAVVLA